MVTKKKTATKKQTVHTKTRAKKATKSTQIVYKTFKVASDSPIFFQPRVTKQTFYWSFLLLFIIIMQLIIIAINVNATLTLDGLR